MTTFIPHARVATKEQARQAAREIATLVMERVNVAFASEGLKVTCRIATAKEDENGMGFSLVIDGEDALAKKAYVDAILQRTLNDMRDFKPSGSLLN